ncbi:MAG: gliding motility-associated C-terminal domain-containing protein [Bacteroidota bacterium]
MKAGAYFVLSLCFFLCIALPLAAQYTGTSPFCYESGGLIINEVSNGPTTTVSEYMEFVVVGNSSDPTAPVNLVGWIIDDNNIASGGEGTAPGHISFGDCYNAVPPGSILVVYNNESPNPVLPPDDAEDSNGDGVYIIPHNHPCLDACFSNPNFNNPLYCPCATTAPNPISWQLGLRNPGDVVQVRDACETLVHAISWGGAVLTNTVQNTPVTFEISNNSQSGRLFHLVHTVNNNWHDVANYENILTTDNETPGQANNPANATFIAELAAGQVVCGGTISDCRDTDAGDLVPPANASSIGPIQICQGEDLDAFANSYDQADEAMPDAVGFMYEYAYILTQNDAPTFSFIDFNTTGDFDFSALTPGTYIVWGFSFVQTNGSLTVNDFLTSFVTSIQDIEDFDNCGYHGDIDNLSQDGVVMNVEILPNEQATPPAAPLTACPDENGVALFDLTALDAEINGGTGVIVNWFIDNTMLSPITDPMNFLSGSTTVYASIGNGLCSSSTVEVTLIIFEAVVPSLMLLERVDCAGGSSATLEVNSTGMAPFDYDWNVDILDGGNPAMDLTAGFYAVTVTSADGCVGTADFTITEPTAITLSCQESIPATTIGGTEGAASITFSGGTPPYDLVWSGPVSGSALAITNSPTLVSDLAGGQYSLTLTDANGCLETCAFEIDAPACGFMIAATSGDVSCREANDGFIDLEITGSGNLPLEILWSDGATESALENLAGGIYTVTVSDPGTCERTLAVEIAEPDSIAIMLQAAPPTCTDEIDGFIQIDAITGGTPPYSITINDDIVLADPSLPFLLDNLDSGNYTINIADENACSFTEEVPLATPEEVGLELTSSLEEGQEEISLGEEVQLIPLPTFTIDTFIWTPVFNNSDQLQPFVQPLETTTYIFTAFSSTGCPISAQITIPVVPNRNVYIPNAFSPNNDGFNDRFFIFAGNNVAQINTFRIFDRWGELLYDRENIAPNDETVGWDGTFRGQAVNPGVMVYIAEVAFLDGRTEIIKGDLLLLR